jgi:hypothetical protein
MRMAPALIGDEEKPETTIVTAAEVAECTCPDFCERDHEQD